MWLIILGLVFIFNGLLQMQKHFEVDACFMLLGIANVGVGIYQIITKKNQDKFKEEACKVIYESLIVFNKSHVLTGVLAELDIDIHFFINRSNSFEGFFQIWFNDTQISYILMDSRFIKVA